MKRTRCGLVVITMLWVRTPWPKNRTPRRNEPSVTPEAAKMMFFPGARSFVW